jgi:hypothetical protein
VIGLDHQRESRRSRRNGDVEPRAVDEMPHHAVDSAAAAECERAAFEYSVSGRCRLSIMVAGPKCRLITVQISEQNYEGLNRMPVVPSPDSGFVYLYCSKRAGATDRYRRLRWFI